MLVIITNFPHVDSLTSCLIYAWALPTHLTVRNCRSFGCVLLLNQIYLTTLYRSTLPLRLIWSICFGN